nr:MAG TPA: hypothetical protein [Caudoviricetes sp.]
MWGWCVRSIFCVRHSVSIQKCTEILTVTLN